VQPLQAVENGAAKGIEVIIGSNRDEAKLFAAGPREPIDDGKLIERVARLLPKKTAARASDLVAVYRKSREGLKLPATNLDILDAITGDEMFRIPSIRLAEAQRPHQPRTLMYLFTYESPARRGSLGACHALELPFVFGTLDAPTQDKFAGTGPVVDRLAQNMMAAWIGFTRAGDPSHPGIGGWSTYDTRERATMIFGRESALERAPFDEERIAWEGVL
jgi:para-nitrobenzyl esterase